MTTGFEIHVALGKIYFMILLKPTLVKFFFYDGRYQSLLSDAVYCHRASEASSVFPMMPFYHVQSVEICHKTHFL